MSKPANVPDHIEITAGNKYDLRKALQRIEQEGGFGSVRLVIVNNKIAYITYEASWQQLEKKDDPC